MTLSYEERRALAYNWLLPWIECHKSLDGCVVVDFGSGEGAYTLPVADHAERVIAVDIDAAVIDKARENVRGARADNVALSAGIFERLLEFVVSQAEGGVDVFLLIATLEHMTVPERLAVLGLARDTLHPDGLLVIWETPNRLLWSDHHTARMPFFHLLPDELALAWLRRVPRADFVDAVRERGPLELWRWGRGASFHELELGFGDLTGRVVAGGYDPATIGLRSVHRDELNLARYLQRELPSVHPAFSRYWLDLIVRRTPSAASMWRPWAFETVDGEGVGVSRWEVVHFTRPGAWLRVHLAQPTSRLLIGVEIGTDDIALIVRDEQWEPVAELRVGGGQGARTFYEVVTLGRPLRTFALQAMGPAVLSFLASEADGRR